jgi:hypothetical protein
MRLHFPHRTQMALAEERVRCSTVRPGSTCPHGNRSSGVALPGCRDADAWVAIRPSLGSGGSSARGCPSGVTGTDTPGRRFGDRALESRRDHRCHTMLVDSSPWRHHATPPARSEAEPIVQAVNGRLVLSPSDLNDYVECQHLTTLALEVARGHRERPFLATSTPSCRRRPSREDGMGVRRSDVRRRASAPYHHRHDHLSRSGERRHPCGRVPALPRRPANGLRVVDFRKSQAIASEPARGAGFRRERGMSRHWRRRMVRRFRSCKKSPFLRVPRRH